MSSDSAVDKGFCPCDTAWLQRTHADVRLPVEAVEVDASALFCARMVHETQ